MEKEFEYDIYMICPVRKATEEEKKLLKEYRDRFEEEGKRVCYPAESTDQNDKSGGYQICKDHTREIVNSNEVYVYWNPESKGSYVDLGTAFPNHFVHNRNIKLINRKTVEDIVEDHEKNGIPKSYEHVLLELDNLANE